ncbi:DUF4386 domain-containing protein [Dyella psychrodurans]|uniref:DUF4386 domain-containing protein n=1 Tax=Dyella psychrodurans TaxID=1927960 RepID=A0A370X059_9GAMM|nr:DUF4386 domain-containing protein [Dyella psychrodurans]RDS81798.1 DUF4386 domain-containing protein [Dyella psychrodurans]
MTKHNVEVSQKAWARVAGAALAAIIAIGLTGVFLQTFVGPESNLQNVLAHEQIYRVSLACEFGMLNSDIVLAIALYGLLKHVNGPLALLGAFWRFANAIVLGVGVVAALTALDLLGFVRDSPALGTPQLPEFAGYFLRMHIVASPIGLFFWSMGAAIHSYLLWQSRYIPRVLSGSYLAVTVVIFAGCLGMMIFPALQSTIDPWFVLPDLPVEIAVALWLMTKGVKIEPLNIRDS